MRMTEVWTDRSAVTRDMEIIKTAAWDHRLVLVRMDGPAYLRFIAKVAAGKQKKAGKRPT